MRGNFPNFFWFLLFGNICGPPFRWSQSRTGRKFTTVIPMLLIIANFLLRTPSSFHAEKLCYHFWISLFLEFLLRLLYLRKHLKISPKMGAAFPSFSFLFSKISPSPTSSHLNRKKKFPSSIPNRYYITACNVISAKYRIRGKTLAEWSPCLLFLLFSLQVKWRTCPSRSHAAPRLIRE